MCWDSHCLSPGVGRGRPCELRGDGVTRRRCDRKGSRCCAQGTRERSFVGPPGTSRATAATWPSPRAWERSARQRGLGHADGRQVDVFENLPQHRSAGVMAPPCLSVCLGVSHVSPQVHTRTPGPQGGRPLPSTQAPPPALSTGPPCDPGPWWSPRGNGIKARFPFVLLHCLIFHFPRGPCCGQNVVF